MTIEIEIGTWIIPFVLTIISFFVANYLTPPDREGGYLSIGNSLEKYFLYSIASIISLIVWLIWAVLT